MNHYLTIHITKRWRVRFSIEHRLDFAIEMFLSPNDEWAGIYLTLCPTCILNGDILWIDTKAKGFD